MGRPYILMMAILLWAGLGSSALADEPRIVPSYGQGFASDAELRSAVGRQTYRMEACAQVDFDEDDTRAVRIDLARGDFERGPVIDALLRNGARFAWRECPRPYYDLVWDKPTGDFHYDVSSIQIYLPDGTLAVQGKLGRWQNGDGITASRAVYEWASVRNVYRETLEANAQAEREAVARQQRGEQRAQQEQRDRDAESAFWGWVRLLLVGALALWAFLKREQLLYWFYSLTPHPASDMVDQAITSGTELDGDAFARATVIKADNPTERSVREAQARQLTQRWRDHEQALRSEEAALVRKEQKRAEDENARLEAEHALLRAALAHEEAAARVEALRKREQTS